MKRMIELPTYNESGACSKCGNKEVSTRYCQCGGQWNYDLSYPICRGEGTPPEHLHRVCKRCCFEWLEAIL